MNNATKSTALKNDRHARIALETMSLDQVVSKVTACKTADELLALTGTGYVPTIIPSKLRGNASVESHLEALCKEMLIALLENTGRKVWKGMN